MNSSHESPWQMTVPHPAFGRGGHRRRDEPPVQQGSPLPRKWLNPPYGNKHKLGLSAASCGSWRPSPWSSGRHRRSGRRIYQKRIPAGSSCRSSRAGATTKRSALWADPAARASTVAWFDATIVDGRQRHRSLCARPAGMPCRPVWFASYAHRCGRCGGLMVVPRGRPSDVFYAQLRRPTCLPNPRPRGAPFLGALLMLVLPTAARTSSRWPSSSAVLAGDRLGHGRVRRTRHSVRRLRQWIAGLGISWTWASTASRSGWWCSRPPCSCSPSGDRGRAHAEGVLRGLLVLEVSRACSSPWTCSPSSCSSSRAGAVYFLIGQ